VVKYVNEDDTSFSVLKFKFEGCKLMLTSSDLYYKFVKNKIKFIGPFSKFSSLMGG